MAAKLSNHAIAVRDLAKRARRLAVTTLAEDADWLLRYADELEAEAADFDRRSEASAEGDAAPGVLPRPPACPLAGPDTRPAEVSCLRSKSGR